MSQPVITIEDDHPEGISSCCGTGLTDIASRKPGLEAQLISVFLRNEQHQVIGGAHGWTAFGWLHIHEKISVGRDGAAAFCRQQKLKL